MTNLTQQYRNNFTARESGYSFKNSHGNLNKERKEEKK